MRLGLAHKRDEVRSVLVRTYRMKRRIVLMDGGEVTALAPIEYVAEGAALTDVFWLSASAFNDLRGPNRIVVTVTRAEQ